MTLDEKVDLILDEMHGLREDVNELKEEVSSLKENVRGQKQEITSIKSELQELTECVDKIEDTTDLLKNEVCTLKNGQMQMNHTLQSVSQHVTVTYDLTLENRGDIMESKVRLKMLEQRRTA